MTEQHLAVVVPFRDGVAPGSQGGGREANLREFVPYMNRFLRRANRHFSIIVVEQAQGLPFNKGALFNVGYSVAMAKGCDYMVLHDVDQLPESPENTYGYPRYPTHLCSASSQNGYRLAYRTMVGGALAVTMEHFRKINGFSNEYWGWGQEDDDLYLRLVRRFGRWRIRRLNRRRGRYRALWHPRLDHLSDSQMFARGRARLEGMLAGTTDSFSDGINTVRYEMLREEQHQGHERWLVDLKSDNAPG
jgi:hypothetical protein